MGKLTKALQKGMQAGAGSRELCVLTPSAAPSVPIIRIGKPDDAAVKRVEALAKRLEKDKLLGATAIRMQNGRLVITRTLASDSAGGFAYVKNIPSTGNILGGKKHEILLRMDLSLPGAKSTEATFLHENGHVLDWQHGIGKSKAIQDAFKQEASVYLNSPAVLNKSRSEALGNVYYARKYDETVAQGISQVLGRKYSVDIKYAEEFEQIFPKTMLEIRKRLAEKLGL